MKAEQRGQRQEHWRKIIAEQRNGGESIAAFCRERGISEPQFYSWRRRLSATARPVTFALVETGAAVRATSVIELSLAGGERIQVTPGTDAALLRMVLSVLRERP
jgi:transposase-like protein